MNRKVFETLHESYRKKSDDLFIIMADRIDYLEKILKDLENKHKKKKKKKKKPKK